MRSRNRKWLLKTWITGCLVLLPGVAHASVVPITNCGELCSQTFFITGLGTPELNVRAGVMVGFPMGYPPSGPDLEASIDVDFLAMGEGAVRPGVANFQIGAGGDGSAEARPSAIAEVAGLGGCDWNLMMSPGCLQTETFAPVMLGVPFRIHVAALVQVFNMGAIGGGSAGGDIWLQLFDEQGEPVNIVEGTAVVPEPSSFALIGIAGSLLGLARLRVRK